MRGELPFRHDNERVARHRLPERWHVDEHAELPM